MRMDTWTSPWLLPRIVDGLRAGWAQWLAWRERRLAFCRLLSLDDDMLRDIGVTREEVERAAGLPLSVNAALELEQAALQRRRGQMW